MQTNFNVVKAIFLITLLGACTGIYTEAPKKDNNLFIKKQPQITEETVVNPVCYKQCVSWKKAQAIDDDTADLECIYECKSVKK